MSVDIQEEHAQQLANAVMHAVRRAAMEARFEIDQLDEVAIKEVLLDYQAHFDQAFKDALRKHRQATRNEASSLLGVQHDAPAEARDKQCV